MFVLKICFNDSTVILLLYFKHINLIVVYPTSGVRTILQTSGNVALITQVQSTCT